MQKSRKVVTFDLDDTLCLEVDFLKSAYQEIANYLDKSQNEQLYQSMLKDYFNHKNVFEELTLKYNVEFTSLLRIYRTHQPKLQLKQDVETLILKLKSLSIPLGIISDGRSVPQRNKIQALGLDKLIDDIVISEEFGYSKPSEKVFKYFMDKYPKSEYYYIGDNLKKDFITANFLRWKTYGIKDKGNNIHSQDVELPIEYYPNQGFIDDFSNLDFKL